METSHSGGYSDNEDRSVQKKPDNTEALVQTEATVTNELLSDIRALIEQARQRMAQTINAELVILNWHIGERIRKDVLAQELAEYGKQIVATVSRQLTKEYGKGFTRTALFRMLQLRGFQTSRLSQHCPSSYAAKRIRSRLSYCK